MEVCLHEGKEILDGNFGMQERLCFNTYVQKGMQVIKWD